MNLFLHWLNVLIFTTSTCKTQKFNEFIQPKLKTVAKWNLKKNYNYKDWWHNKHVNNVLKIINI